MLHAATPRSGMRGEQLFNQVGCAQCHNPSFTTANDPSLEPLRDALWEPINNKPLASIYPPLMQVLFVLGVVLGGQVWTIKLLALLGLVGAVVVVSRFADRAVAPLALALTARPSNSE